MPPDRSYSARGATALTPGATLAIPALALGAMAMGASPVFVRLADVGPFASAFWRMALALPFLWAWQRYERSRMPQAAAAFDPARDWPIVALIGFFFAGDLFFWHLAILATSVANATLLATMSPIVVALGAWLALREAIDGRVLTGLACGMAGMTLLLGGSARFAPGNLYGDLCGLATALFFGAYLIATRRARRRLPAATVMFYPALVTAALLLAVALLLDDRVLPASLAGWAPLVGLALVSQIGGQGLAIYALGHLPAVFSSLVIFVEVIAAVVLAWAVLGEMVSLWQAAGGALILAGIYAARPRRQATGAAL